MSLFDKILNWIRPKSSNTFEPVPNRGTETTFTKDKKILFSHVDSKNRYSVKYTTTMINTITLSSDMKTLFLIDNGRAISFPIDTNNGVLIGAIKGQIAVATSLTQDEEEGGGTDGADLQRARPGHQSIIKVGTAKKQWTLAYNKRTGLMSIIGATEIDSSIRAESNCEEHRVNLNESVVKIKRKGDEITLAVYPK